MYVLWTLSGMLFLAFKFITCIVAGSTIHKERLDDRTGFRRVKLNYNAKLDNRIRIRKEKYIRQCLDIVANRLIYLSIHVLKNDGVINP